MATASPQEMQFTLMHGNWYDTEPDSSKHIVQNIADSALAGNYLAVKLSRAFLNIKLEKPEVYQKADARQFSLLDVVFENLWDYPIARVEGIVIDSNGYQHRPEPYPDFTVPIKKELFPEAEESLPQPATDIASKSKTKGYMWFKPFGNELFPHRFIFKLNIFSPGHTSGQVVNTETLELVVAEYTVVPLR